MKNESRGIEWKVGVFMLIGLGVVAYMAIAFGKFSQGLKKYYMITAEFPNASGLLKGADVNMAGARVGFTADAPTLIEGRSAVRVVIKIRDGIKIPRAASFLVSSSGFLGDAYVSINPPVNPDMANIFKNGDTVMGTRLEGFGDLAVKGGDVMDELKKRLQELETPIKDIRERVLSDKNLKAIDETFASLNELTRDLKGSVKGIDEVIAKAKAAVDTVKDTVGSVKAPIAKIDAAAADLKATLASIKSAAASADKALDSAKVLIGKANAGKGALGMLLTDKETSDNLKALIQNLREHGILWYKNKGK